MPLEGVTSTLASPGWRSVRRPLFLGLAIVGAATALTSPARAGTYCVATPTCAGGSYVPSFGAALGFAGMSSEADTIRLGPGTFSSPTLS